MKPATHVLISASRNVRCESFLLQSPNPARPWSVRLDTLHGGKQEGAQLLTVDNGRLRLTILPTRGMGVLDAHVSGLRLGWNSPVKEVVHPQWVNLQSRGGLGWLDGFNEWIVRCGLESAGAPGRDEFTTNTGARAEMDLTLHGKIANIPASELEVTVGDRIRVRGVVHERMFYGPKLELRTEISTAPGEASFRVEDSVTNHGAAAQEFQLLYHVNFGAPLLEEGAKFLAPVARVMPINAPAARSVAGWRDYAGPTAGFVEEVYCLEPLADARGRTTLLLHNAAADRGASLTCATAELPCVTLWKNTAAEADGYVTGIEPATGFPQTRGAERRAGRVPVLAAGETRRFTVDYAALTDAAAVADVARRIEAIQGGREARVERKAMG